MPLFSLQTNLGDPDCCHHVDFDILMFLFAIIGVGTTVQDAQVMKYSSYPAKDGFTPIIAISEDVKPLGVSKSLS
jgi:hypothetical protein